jgi:hypothetical protein
MHVFVINVSETRKTELSKHFEKMGIDKKYKITWSGEYLNTHSFVTWLKLTHAKHMSINSISNHLNWFNSLKKGVELDEDYFMIVCDDVVFPHDWETRIDNLNLLPANNISEGVCYHIPYSNDYTITGNFGGMEAIIFQKSFAQFILDNIDFNQCLDIVIGAMLLYHKFPLAITPICHQTSILTDKSSTGDTTYPIDWITYTRQYKPSNISYRRYKNEYNDFMLKKTLAEKLFFEKFATKLDIWNIEYIETKYLLKR